MTTHSEEHPLLAAIEADDDIAVAEALALDIDPGALATAFAMAAMLGAVRFIDPLLDAGADVDDVDGGGDPPLFLAALNRQTEVAKLLLSHGADPDIPNEEEVWTPLMVAARNGDEPLVRILLDVGADPAFTNGEGDTALNLAAGNGHRKIVELLLPHADAAGRDEATGLLTDLDEIDG